MSSVLAPLPSSPSALRNRAVIADALAEILPAGLTGISETSTLLEIASGTGEHAVHFVERLPQWTIQPTEATAEACAQIDRRVLESAAPRVERAKVLDVTKKPWPVERADAVLTINMLHASLPETLPGLMEGAASVLPAGCLLVTYGPYRIDGRHTSPSNEDFDAWLKRERDPRWGVRDFEEVCAEAARCGLVFERRIAMPANNFVLVFRR